MTERMPVRPLPPPGFAGGINGFTYAHSSSVRSLGYLRWSRLYFDRFSCVHIGGPSANQTTSFEPQEIQWTQEVLKRTLRSGAVCSHIEYSLSEGACTLCCMPLVVVDLLGASLLNT